MIGIATYVYADLYDSSACPGKKDCPSGFIALSCSCCAALTTATPDQLNIPGTKDGCCPGWIQVKDYPNCCPLGYTLNSSTDTECVFVSCDSSHTQVIVNELITCKPKSASSIIIH